MNQYYTGVHGGHYFVGYVNERGFRVFFLLKPTTRRKKLENVFFLNNGGLTDIMLH